MTQDGLGPRADVSLADLPKDTTVLVERLSGELHEVGSTIHDPLYIEDDSPDRYAEMSLAEALAGGYELCCDCFETAWIDQLTRRSEGEAT